MSVTGGRARRAAVFAPVVAATACIGAAVPFVGAWMRTASPVKLIIMTAVGFGVTLLLSRSHLSRRDWFFPLALPLTYVSLALILPVLFVVLTGRPLEGIQVGVVSMTVLAVFGLTLLGWAIGSAIGITISRPSPPMAVRVIDHEQVGRLGTLALAAGLTVRSYTATTRFGLPYGADSVGFSVQNALDNAASFLAFLAVILITTANAPFRRSLATRIDFWLFGAYALLTLSVGTRAPLLAPLLFALWARHTYIRRISFFRGLTVALALAFVLQGVSGVRAGDRFYAGSGPSLERAVNSLGTPLVVTHLVAERVPKVEPFENGSTYVAAVKRQLPGPLAVALLGEPQDTAAFVFRDIIGFTSPDAGLGFALPAEGYLNFGFRGAFGAALLAGLLLGYAYRKQVMPPSRALHVLYPILVATLPLNLRSDALTQIKTVLYPMICLLIVYRVCGLGAPSAADHVPNAYQVRSSPASAES
jgi:hypothetical protein